MTSKAEDREFRKRMERLDSLIQEAERNADPRTREQVREIVQALLDLHGTGLTRLLEKIAATGETGLSMIDSLAGDNLVGSLLLLHGLHPLDLETRVRQALEKVRPYLRSQGGTVELLSITDGVVRLRMQGRNENYSSNVASLEQAMEQGIIDKAPDVTAIKIEQAPMMIAQEENGFSRMALPMLRR